MILKDLFCINCCLVYDKNFYIFSIYIFFPNSIYRSIFQRKTRYSYFLDKNQGKIRIIPKVTFGTVLCEKIVVLRLEYIIIYMSIAN